MYRRRRRRALLGAVLALVLAATAFAASRHLLKADDRSYLVGDEDRSSLLDGQAWHKVMTAYVVRKDYPLHAGDSGPRFVVGQDDVEDTEARRREGQSVVAVRAGEQLIERDALMAILLPSANNVAVLVARQVSGSVASFVAATAR